MYYEGNVHSTIDSSFVVYESTPYIEVWCNW